MATNPYINKVEFDGDTLMDLTGDTVSPSDVLLGETFHDRSGAPQTGTLDPYEVGDTAETDIADGDYFPFYDTSASAKKKSLWSNIVAKMKTAFGISSGSTYLKKDGTWGTPTDTKNTAGSTDTSDKIYLVGAKSQAANPQTYSDNEVFAQDGVLSSKKLSPKCITALTGTGTAGQDKGSGSTNRYVPALWTFNSGITVADGEVYFIKIPVAGGTWGVYLSLNNGTNYYPVAISNAKARFQTQSPKNSVIAVSYESAGVCNCYARGGADALADVTGCFRVVDSYDSNTTYSAMSVSELTTGTATTARSVRADYLKSGIDSLIDTKINALDVTGETGIAASKTVKAWSETDGKVSLTTQDIEITKSQVSDFPSIDDNPTSGSSNLVKSGGVYSKMVHEITRTVSSAAANSQIRIPASGTDSRISTANTCVVKPICQEKSDGTPYKFKSCVVSAGYATITVSEALSNVTIGVEVVNI